MKLIATFCLLLIPFSVSASPNQCQSLFETPISLRSNLALKSYTSTLAEISPLNSYAVHGMQEVFLEWLVPIYKETGHAPKDWPFREGKMYPGLWTAFKPNDTLHKHTDGNNENFSLGDGNGRLVRGVVLRFNLDTSKEIFVINDFDVPERIREELKLLKAKDVGASHLWRSWRHLRKETIKASAEAGYSALYFVSTNELVILDSRIILSIEKYASRQGWVEL